MALMEKTKFWRRMGAMLNTGTGAAVNKVTGDLVNRVTAAAMTPRLSGEVPWTAPTKPLAESAVALVSTAGFHLRGDEPFDVDAQLGDPSYRSFPKDVRANDLVVSHTHYPHRYVDADVNVLLPIDRLRELESAGALRVAPRVFSFGFAGTITREIVDPEAGTAHTLAEELKADQVDLVLLVPA